METNAAFSDDHSSDFINNQLSAEASQRTNSQQNNPLEDFGVRVQNANFSYSGYERNLTLDNVNINVPTGVTYALLGPSGCGKTTLLKCVAGLITLNSGDIKVLGETPGSKDSSVPGHGLGFMPQEEALYGQFTIKALVTMFGKLKSVSEKVILETLEQLTSLLDLPLGNESVSTLSGGERRRVSLACAMVGCPPLLILDEPTVGVDPLLRTRIWKYLNLLASSKGMTIVITTHYIEEAKDADIIGMMRNGKILAEATPSRLKKFFKTPKLEDCFVQLCLKCSVNNETRHDEQQVEKKSVFSSVVSFWSACKRVPTNTRSAKTISSSTPQNVENASELQFTTEQIISNRISKKATDSQVDEKALIKSDRNASSRLQTKRFEKIQVLLLRNYWMIKKNIVLVLFQFGLPVLQSILFAICVGHELFGLPVAIVNDETPPIMSKIFLQHIDDHILKETRFDDLQTAIKSVELGTNAAVLHIGQNYTRCLLKRFQLGLNVDNGTINCSSMKAYVDFSSNPISSGVIQSFLKSQLSFQEAMLETIGASTLLVKPGIDVSNPVYGNLDTTFTEYILPNVIVYFAFFLAVALTAVTFILEKKSGIFDRLKMSGVTLNQMLVSHILLEMLIIIIQAMLLITIPNLAFGFKTQGSIVLIAFLVLLLGVLGIIFGLFISAITTNEATALNLLMGIVYPGCILSGFLWPVEGMPYVLRVVSKLVFLTLPSDAVRSITQRGWGLDNYNVYMGFVSAIAWILLTLALTVAVLKIKK